MLQTSIACEQIMVALWMLALLPLSEDTQRCGLLVIALLQPQVEINVDEMDSFRTIKRLDV